MTFDLDRLIKDIYTEYQQRRGGRLMPRAKVASARVPTKNTSPPDAPRAKEASAKDTDGRRY